MAFFFVLLFFGLGIMMVAGGLITSWLVAPRRPGRLKDAPYECGELPVGRAWVQYNVGYYLFGLLFLVFDVEAAFLYPWAAAFRELGLVGFIEMGIFLLVLVLGLIYAWKKGVLEWV